MTEFNLTTAELVREFDLAKRSEFATRARLDAALSVGCAEHDAEPGTFCWGDTRSGVSGLCSARYAYGSAHPAAFRLPDPLDDSAAVVGMARSNAEAREHEHDLWAREHEQQRRVWRQQRSARQIAQAQARAQGGAR